MNGYDWQFGVWFDPETWALLCRGLAMTFGLSLPAFVLGTVLGAALGVVAAWRDPTSPLFLDAAGQTASAGRVWFAVRHVARAVIDVLRAIPLLLFILLAYYGLPVLARLVAPGVQVSSEVSVIVALSLNLAAFVGDLVRAAFYGLSRSQMEAALALALPTRVILKSIVGPAILQEVWPGLILLYITIFKMSTLASSVAVYELLHSGNLLIQESYRPLEIYLLIGLIFIVIVAPLTALARNFERNHILQRRSA